MQSADTVRLLRPAEVAERLNVELETLSAWRIQGRGLPFVRFNGRVVRYRESDVEAFIDSNTVAVGDAA